MLLIKVLAACRNSKDGIAKHDESARPQRKASQTEKGKTGTVGGRSGLDATSSSYVAFSRHHSFPALLNVPATESLS